MPGVVSGLSSVIYYGFGREMLGDISYTKLSTLKSVLKNDMIMTRVPWPVIKRRDHHRCYFSTASVKTVPNDLLRVFQTAGNEKRNPLAGTAAVGRRSQALHASSADFERD